ncbi:MULTISPECIES: hypothetical protein [Kitasatospora]|uniref:Uncharacterized protein n=1 Tax=Kitasatospora setae (strain ATCC 33774 / DSM 43861 / JCM 3304 / KCC A-0304 / NBRC 14216 / KM-6054) TaxID=452652 RepID=E4NIJ9_KITSK|nr:MULTISPECIES: hypothetical protein [Kitasatospora]BAJ32797.1 hypothetical protein KSE_70390 [Kitasatospora setae KM-6054]
MRGTVRAAENAVTDYHDLMNARLRQFEHLVAGELPVLRADLGLDVAACRGLDEYVRGLRYRIVGQFDFHRRTARYRPEEQRHQPAVARRAPLWPVPAGSPSPGSPSPGSVPAGFVPPGVPRLPVHRMG